MYPKSSAIGKAVDRVEGRDKVTGSARYAADFTFADLAYAVLVQSDVAHGRIDEPSLRASTAAAESAPGVLRVITPLNLPQLNVLPRDLTYDLPLERRPPLSDLAVHHVGQHVAVFVADTLENATYAASLFKLEYHVLEPMLDAWNRCRSTSPARREQWSDPLRQLPAGPFRQADGGEASGSAARKPAGHVANRSQLHLHDTQECALSDRAVIHYCLLGRRKVHGP
jgi:CO/xanthine dehydrogenase Mo-binding subunit